MIKLFQPFDGVKPYDWAHESKLFFEFCWYFQFSLFIKVFHLRFLSVLPFFSKCQILSLLILRNSWDFYILVKSSQLFTRIQAVLFWMVFKRECMIMTILLNFVCLDSDVLTCTYECVYEILLTFPSRANFIQTLMMCIISRKLGLHYDKNNNKS